MNPHTSNDTSQSPPPVIVVATADHESAAPSVATTTLELKEKSSQSESSDDASSSSSATIDTSSEKASRTAEELSSAGGLNLIEEVEVGRERIKRHRVEVAGRVWIPEIWGQEDLLKDWTDCSGFEASLMNSTVMSARAALIEEGRRANSRTLSMEGSC